MYPRTTHSTGSMSSLRTTSARPRTSSGTPSVALRKWLGTIWPVRSNQKTLSAVSTLPLSGMGVGWTTSYVEMRSEATMSRRSPRSYISRTFPDARRGRSETGGMGRRLSGLEDDDGDHAVGIGLVVRVVRIDLDEARPESLALLALGPPRADPTAVTADLDLGLRIGHQVVEPRRVLVGAALAGHDHEAVAVVEVDQRLDALLAALGARVVQQEDRRLLDMAAEPPAARAVDGDVGARHDVEQLPERGGGGGRLHAPRLYGSPPWRCATPCGRSWSPARSSGRPRCSPCCASASSRRSTRPPTSRASAGPGRC